MLFLIYLFKQPKIPLSFPTLGPENLGILSKHLFLPLYIHSNSSGRWSLTAAKCPAHKNGGRPTCRPPAGKSNAFFSPAPDMCALRIEYPGNFSGKNSGSSHRTRNVLCSGGTLLAIGRIWHRSAQNTAGPLSMPTQAAHSKP